MSGRKREAIDSFTGENFYLSNFYELNAGVVYDGVEYPTTEHAYQAAKTLNAAERLKIRDCATPAAAKKLGRKVELRWGWDDIKTGVMYQLLQGKFMRHVSLAMKLFETEDAYLEEGNNWGDIIWGTVNGKGENYLGRLLMVVRDEIQYAMHDEAGKYIGDEQ